MASKGYVRASRGRPWTTRPRPASWPGAAMGRKKGTNVIAISYSQDVANRFGRRVIAIMTLLIATQTMLVCGLFAFDNTSRRFRAWQVLAPRQLSPGGLGVLTRM